MVVPDIYVRAAPDGIWQVELNSDTLPRLLMNARYYGEVSSSAKRDEDKAFLTECAANASWLIKTLDQRGAHDPQGRAGNRASAGRLSSLMASNICGR